MQVTYDENNKIFVDRVEFMNSIVKSILKKFPEKLICIDIDEDSVKIDTRKDILVLNTGFNLNKYSIVELILLYTLLTYRKDDDFKIMFYLKIKDSLKLVDVGLVVDNDILIGGKLDDRDYDFYITISTKYIMDVLVKKRVLSVNTNLDSSILDIDDNLSPLVTSLTNKYDNTTLDDLGKSNPNDTQNESLHDLNMHQVEKMKREKELDEVRKKVDKVSHPLSHLKRSMAQKKNWAKHRSRIQRGIDKYHDSDQGKAQHERTGIINSLLNELDKLKS